MNPVIYTVRKVEFRVGGTLYDVSNFSMTLEGNSVPMYQVGISAEPSQGVSKRSIVHSLSIDDLKKAFLDLQQKAVDLTECSLSLDLEANGGPLGVSLTTKLDLDGWLLVNVGMSEITTTRVFSLTCWVAHPAWRLTLATGFMAKGTGVEDLSQYVEGIQDPYDASKKAIELCQKMLGQPVQKLIEEGIPTSVGNTELKQMIEQITSRLGDVRSAAENNLMWDKEGYVTHGSDIPGESVLKDVAEGIKYAILLDWVRGMQQDSYWNALLNVKAEYGAEILPTYDRPDKKLVIAPCMPWKDSDKCRVEVVDDMVWSVELPGRDLRPLFGYLAETDMVVPAGGLITATAAGAEKTSSIPAVFPFIPKNPNKSVGAIVHVQVPDWIDSARMKASLIKHTKGVLTTGANYSEDLAIPIVHSSGDNEQLKRWEPGINMHLNNLFVTSYKETVGATLRCPFFTKVDGKTVFPGQRLKFVTRKSTLFYGTITRMVLAVDCARSMAETQIFLSYCTFAGGADGEILGETVIAPYYEASGSLEW